MKKFTVAIDGPAGSGKSTISKRLAKILAIDYIDTGAMYRALTLKILRNRINIESKSDIKNVLEKTHIDFKNNHIFLDNEEVNEEIRSNEISNNVSDVAKIKEVRERLVEIQRNISKDKSVVMDGRDIGSFVLPNAEFKFYITASIDERSKRRYKELVEKGYIVEIETLIKEIEKRDVIDSTREFAPLLKCDDAYEIDTTYKTIDEVIFEILEIINEEDN